MAITSYTKGFSDERFIGLDRKDVNQSSIRPIYTQRHTQRLRGDTGAAVVVRGRFSYSAQTEAGNAATTRTKAGRQALSVVAHTDTQRRNIIHVKGGGRAYVQRPPHCSTPVDYEHVQRMSYD